MQRNAATGTMSQPVAMQTAPLRPVLVEPAAPPMMAEPALPQPIMAAEIPEDGGGAYTLDSGDKLRVVVFGQDGLSSSYSVDPSGRITMPLIGAVHARGLTTAGLQQAIVAKLAAAKLGDTQLQRDLTISLTRIGALYAISGMLPEGLASFQQAAVILEKLLVIEPNNRTFWKVRHKPDRRRWCTGRCVQSAPK